MDRTKPGSTLSQSEMMRVLRDQAVPWNDIRERRVLTRITKYDVAKKPAKWRLAALAAGVLVSLGTAFYFGVGKLEIAGETPNHGDVKMAYEGESRLSLAEFGIAVLYGGAEVEVVEQGALELTLTQTNGRVRYEIHHRPKRSVKVRALDAVVHVIGTCFFVEVEGDKVRVHVDEGEVEVDDGEQVTKLSSGEALSVVIRAKRHSLTGLEVAMEPIGRAEGKTTKKREKAPQDGLVQSVPDANPNPAVPEDPIKAALVSVDTARRGGNLHEAAAILRKLIQDYPGDPRLSALLFTLGNVERTRGNHAVAAEVFKRCWQKMPGAPLAEDAMAEEAASLSRAGQLEMANNAAKAYLRIYPRGLHQARMERLAK